jgi:hypothetical protein
MPYRDRMTGFVDRQRRSIGFWFRPVAPGGLELGDRAWQPLGGARDVVVAVDHALHCASEICIGKAQSGQCLGLRGGFIGFEDNGRLMISPVAHRPSLLRMGIDSTRTLNVGTFTSGQRPFLDFHRNAVL